MYWSDNVFTTLLKLIAWTTAFTSEANGDSNVTGNAVFFSFTAWMQKLWICLLHEMSSTKSAHSQTEQWEAQSLLEMLQYYDRVWSV